MEWLDQDSTLRYLWPTGWPNDWAIGIATHLTMTHGLFPDGMLPHLWLEFLGAAWSLSTEWQFYLLALLIGARLGLRPLAWLFLALAAASIAWQVVAPEPWQFSRAFLPNKAQYFALGIASAIMVREGARGLGSYLPVLGAALVLCLAQGGVRKAAAAAGLDSVSGGAIAARRCRFPQPAVISAKPRAMGCLGSQLREGDR